VVEAEAAGTTGVAGVAKITIRVEGSAMAEARATRPKLGELSGGMFITSCNFWYKTN